MCNQDFLLSSTMEQQQKNNNTTKIILIVIILILLGVIAYLLTTNSQKSDKIDEQNQELKEKGDSLDKNIEALEEIRLRYASLSDQYKELGKNNDSLNARVKEVEDLIAKVKKSSGKERKELLARIEALNAELEAKETEIIRLRAVVDSQKTTIDTLNTRTRVLNDTINNVRSQNSELSQKVAIASVLKAENIHVSVVTNKAKVLVKEEYKAKDIHKLEIAFTLGDNKVARKNDKFIALRLIEPSGSVVFETANEGGFFKSAENGKEIAYTQKRIVSFSNTHQPVVFSYIKGSPYKIGTYTVEIWADGNKIGESQ